MKIGKKIKYLRKKHGITQEQLAENLGISFQAVSKWENEIALPDITLVPVLASFFGVTTDYLFDYTVPNTSIKLKIFKPETYEDVNKILELFSKYNVVMINCENISKEIVKRIKDKIASDIADVQITQIAEASCLCTIPPMRY